MEITSAVTIFSVAGIRALLIGFFQDMKSLKLVGLIMCIPFVLGLIWAWSNLTK